MVKTPIFVGPTLWDDPVLKDDRFDWRPPAGEGDLYKAAQGRPRAIGLIDGVFETVPSVWHKEILWALSQGIHVFGSASMGALRAVELKPFGMVGIGAVYEDYLSGALRDDDEVALTHAPAELGYRPLSEALVDMRATLAKATQFGIVSQRTAAKLTAIGKSMFFKDRTWKDLLALAGAASVPGAQLASLQRWLPANRVEQKRRDGLQMVEAIRKRLSRRHQAFRPAFAFNRTVHWQNLVARYRNPSS